jgi:UDP-N-acetyl-D-glucosamine/UDP-N-acetyl-D-galactosamine dehydrogenase
VTRTDKRIVVIGLGYVGLPLAVALARQFDVSGFDIDKTRIDELHGHHDRTAEVDEVELAHSPLKLTSDPADCRGADIYIVTVPTPVDSDNKPDLRPVEAASRTVGELLAADRRPIVVYESTVYPGVTEEICAPILERHSGLTCGRDFFLGYSPERINPGDREHRVETIVKVVAGQTPEATERLAQLYGSVTSAGVFRASSIKVAEAAKVIENAQRDINIAFMNEITQLFAKLDLSIWDVLDAASTKWNFLPFQPGLVGGHCIGVDPYYLSYRAQQVGHQPDVILAGRSINDGMGRWIAECLHALRGDRAGSALILGLTFKEDVPDLRNSRVVDMIEALREKGHVVTVHDPLADPGEARREYGLELEPAALEGRYDIVLAAVAHQEYRNMAASDIRALVCEGGCVADLKGIWRRLDLGAGIQRWSL